MPVKIEQPFPLFRDKIGFPLDGGLIYIGASGLNPETNPIQCYFDEDFTLLAPQPLRTINGYISRNGSPANIFLKVAECSITIKDRFRITQYTDLHYQLANFGALSASQIFDEVGISQQQVNNGLNSIQELLNILSPKHGNRQFVKSYNLGQGEGGGYFIFDENRQAENDGVSIFNGWLRQTDYYTFEMAGSKHDGSDDSVAFNRVFNLAKSQSIFIKSSNLNEYRLDTFVDAKEINSVTWFGGGCKINITDSINAKNLFGFTLEAIKLKNTTLWIQDVVVDATAVFKSDLPAQTEEFCTRVWRPHFFDNVYIGNTSQNKVLGYCFQFYDCKNVVVDGFTGTNVGGNNSPAGFDSLGDVFYIGDRQGVTNYEFRNFNVNGVIQNNSSGSPLPSRALIVAEILFPADNTDVTTNIKVINGYATNFMRTLHNETSHGDINYSIDNLISKGTSVFSLYVGNTGTGSTTVDCINTKVSFSNVTYAGTHTMNWGVNLTIGSGCEIDGTNVTNLLIQNSQVPTKVCDGAKILNIKGLLASNGNIEASNSLFYFSESYGSFYLFGSVAILRSCKLFNIENTSIKLMSRDQDQLQLTSCEVNNLNFKASCYFGSKSKIFMNTTLTGYALKYILGRSADIYLNGLIRYFYQQTTDVSTITGLSNCNDMLVESNYLIKQAGLPNAPDSGWAFYMIRSTYCYDFGEGQPNGQIVSQLARNLITGATKIRLHDFNDTFTSWT